MQFSFLVQVCAGLCVSVCFTVGDMTSISLETPFMAFISDLYCMDIIQILFHLSIAAAVSCICLVSVCDFLSGMS